MVIVNSQPEACEIILSTNLTKSLFAEIFRNHLISIICQIEIDIEQLVAYTHKNGLEDPFFRRLKLIV